MYKSNPVHELQIAASSKTDLEFPCAPQFLSFSSRLTGRGFDQTTRNQRLSRKCDGFADLMLLAFGDVMG